MNPLEPLIQQAHADLLAEAEQLGAIRLVPSSNRELRALARHANSVALRSIRLVALRDAAATLARHDNKPP